MMNSKLSIQQNVNDDENLFSKVLSGMKSVFNSATKNRKKSSDFTANTEVCNEEEIVADDYDDPQDSQNESTCENVLGINEFQPNYPNLSAVTPEESMIPQYEICVVDIPAQSTLIADCSINENIHEIATVESVQQCSSQFFFVTESEQQNFSLIESDIVTIDAQTEETTTVETPSPKPTESRKKKQIQKKKSKLKPKGKNRDDGEQVSDDRVNVRCDFNKTEIKDDAESSQNKPRIVLKFRSDKSGARTTNMKIVSDYEKTEPETSFTSRRSPRGKVPNNSDDGSTEDSKRSSTKSLDSTGNDIKTTQESDENSKTSLPSRRNRRGLGASQNESNPEESISRERHSIKRSARRRSKEFCENVLANAIARKEKIYNETSGQTRLSRRIKPTAKILANRELRLGLETQNNARLALVSEKQNKTEDVKVTRTSSKKLSKSDSSMLKIPNEKPKAKKQKSNTLSVEKKNGHDGKTEHKKDESISDSFFIDISSIGSSSKNLNMGKSHFKHKIKRSSKNNSEEDNENKRLNKLKKKHLKKLGLKAVSDKNQRYVDDSDVMTDESTMDSTNTEAIIEHLNTRDQLNINLSSENKEDILEESIDYNFENSHRKQSNFKKNKNNKGAKRKHLIIDNEDSLEFCKKFDKIKDDEEISFRITRKRSRMSNSCERDTKKEPSEQNIKRTLTQNSNGNGNIMSCFCNEESTIFADPKTLSDPEFCHAIENIGGRSVGCGRVVSSNQLVRAGSRASFFMACDLHRKRLAMHHCCAGCGVFCTQGIYYQCSEGHLFHWECSLPFVPLLIPPSQINDQDSTSSVEQAAAPKGTITDLYNAEPGCPHCGLDPINLEPVNINCYKVNLKMNCSTQMIFLPSPRLQWVPARMSFTSNSKSVENIASEDNSSPILPLELMDTLKNYFFDSQNENSSIDYLDMIGKERDLDVDLINAVYDSENTIEKILIALQSGADPRKRISLINDGTLMHLAALEFNLNALYIFKTIGLDVNAYDNEQRTPLMLAILNYDNEIDLKDSSELRNSLPDDMDDSDLCEEKRNIVGNTVLYRKIIDYLMTSGSDQTLKGPNGATAFHFAAKQGDSVTCLSILNNKSFKTRSLVNRQDDNGLTPLVWAIENKQNAIARILLEHGANPMCRDLESNTPLHWAALTGCKIVVDYLLNFGSDINAVNANDDTPLHLCARQNHYNCLIVLLARGASISCKNLDGETPIDCISDDGSECYMSLAINEQLQNVVKCPTIDEKIISNDVSNGKEPNPVKCINSVDDENVIDKFVYITQNCFTVDINIDRKISSMQICNCKDGCSQTDASCACANVSMQSWYDANSRLVSYFDYRDPPMIFECNDICSCNKLQCVNRCIDKGSSVALKVFKQRENSIRGGGWGVCTTQSITKGTFVVEYIGEILPGSLAYHRDDDSYLFELENKGDILQDGIEPYCIDAKKYGNVSRFINHKCEPNLVPVRVFVEHRDLRFPRIAFFACKDINAGDELGFDYGEKFWNIKSKSFSCNCGSSKCRYNHVDETKVDFDQEASDEEENEYEEVAE